MKKAVTLAVLLCLHTFALAAEPGAPAPLVEAIARQESGLNPLAVNIAGKSYYPATREEAEQLIQKAITSGQSFDVGTMQINSWWMERLALDPVLLLDPATNERWRKWILAEEIAQHCLNWKAVGKYNSPDTERGRQYAWFVYRHYAGPGASLTGTDCPNFFRFGSGLLILTRKPLISYRLYITGCLHYTFEIAYTETKTLKFKVSGYGHASFHKIPLGPRGLQQLLCLL